MCVGCLGVKLEQTSCDTFLVIDLFLSFHRVAPQSQALPHFLSQLYHICDRLDSQGIGRFNLWSPANPRRAIRSSKVVSFGSAFFPPFFCCSQAALQEADSRLAFRDIRAEHL